MPAKKNVSKPKNKKQYGGPGSFVPSDGPANSSFENVNDSSLSSRLSSANSLYDVARREAVPPSLRPSSSLAKIDLYQAPYETNRSHNSVSSVDSLANDFGQLTVKQDNLSRRTSLPVWYHWKGSLIDADKYSAAHAKRISATPVIHLVFDVRLSRSSSAAVQL